MSNLGFMHGHIKIACAPGLSRGRVVKHENIGSVDDISHIEIDHMTKVLRGTMV